MPGIVGRSLGAIRSIGSFAKSSGGRAAQGVAGMGAAMQGYRKWVNARVSDVGLAVARVELLTLQVQQYASIQGRP
jgi:hypothetical protein